MLVLISCIISLITTAGVAMVWLFFEITQDKILAAIIGYGSTLTILALHMAITQVRVNINRAPATSATVCKFEKCDGNNSKPVACVMGDRMIIPTK